MHDQSETVLTELHDEVLLVTLNRPYVRNAMDPSLLDELGRALDRVDAPEVRAVVITGAGTAFCSGADLRAANRAEPVRLLRYHFNPVMQKLGELGKPIVTAINGAAIGAGMALALTGDVRIAGAGASLTPRFVQIGFTPDAGASYFVNRLLGPGRSVEWFLTGRTLAAGEARQWGLVSEVVPDDEVVTRALKAASELAALPGKVAALTRHLVSYGAHASLPEQLESGIRVQLVNIGDGVKPRTTVTSNPLSTVTGDRIP
jgi:2-(1,2-epoxy-1,2-dihydrophenyl)acetyl-CoA isomerase